MMCEDDMLELLHQACSKGDIDEVHRLLDLGAKVNDVITGRSKTALFCAAANGHADICILLIARGAKVKNVENNEYCPLSHFVIHKSLCT